MQLRSNYTGHSCFRCLPSFFTGILFCPITIFLRIRSRTAFNLLYFGVFRHVVILNPDTCTRCLPYCISVTVISAIVITCFFEFASISYAYLSSQHRLTHFNITVSFFEHMASECMIQTLRFRNANFNRYAAAELRAI